MTGSGFAYRAVARRSVIIGAASLGVAAGMAPGPATAGPAPVRLTLPAPTGPYPVGTTSVHLVDADRVDPLAPTARPRELMVRLWYPAVPFVWRPVAGYLPALQSSVLIGQANALLGTDFPADLLTFPTHSRSAPPAGRGPNPVLLFSPGLGTNAALYTAILEDLASHGYVVAGIDHTFDAPVVEFPGGRLEFENRDALADHARLLSVRVADVRFVLDRLTDGDGGLPSGLRRALDLTRVAAFGHSMGSMTTVGTVTADARITAGIALDGNPLGPASLDRPFLMLGNQNHRRADDPDWAAFYDRLRGPRLHLVIDGALHHDLSDFTIFKAMVDFGALAQTGPIPGPRSLLIQRRYLTAWLDQTLRGRPSRLLRGESPHFPEVDFQP